MTLAELLENRIVECCGLQYMRREDGLIAPRRVDQDGADYFDLGAQITDCADCGQPIDPLVRAGVLLSRDDQEGSWW